MGGESVIGGSGEIAQLTFKPEDIDDMSLSFGVIDVRDGQNRFIPALGEGLQYRLTPELPGTYGLSQNYPFNMRARISYQLPEAGLVTIKVYNIRGQEVRTLVNEFKEAGYHDEIWDGRNDAGQEIASGVYAYIMEAKDFKASRKMVLIK